MTLVQRRSVVYFKNLKLKRLKWKVIAVFYRESARINLLCISLSGVSLLTGVRVFSPVHKTCFYMCVGHDFADTGHWPKKKNTTITAHITNCINLTQLTSLAKFVPQPPKQTFISGRPGIILCSAVGNPAPHFKWSKEDGRLENGRFIPLANGRLMVKSIQREDKGTYYCKIDQSRGSESTSEKSQKIEVIVIGKMRKKYRYLKLNHQYKKKGKIYQRNSMP